MLLLLLAMGFPANPDELPVAPPPRPAGIGLLPGADPTLADWTPRPALGHHEPWERATDKDWIDGRFRDMDTGPFLNCTTRYPLGKGQQTVYKATVVRLGAKGEAAAVFDRNTLRLSAAWTGGYLNHSDRRFGLLNTPTPKGEMQFAVPTGPGWAEHNANNLNGNWEVKDKKTTAPLSKDWGKYRGLHVHGDKVAFEYTVNGTRVVEMLSQEFSAGRPCVVMSLRVDPHEHMLNRFIAEIGEGDEFLSLKEGMVSISTRGDALRVIVIHDPSKKLQYVRAPKENRLVIQMPENRVAAEYRIAVSEHPKQDIAKLWKLILDSPFFTTIPDLTKGGPKRWSEPIVTPLVRGDESGPFAVDTLTIPYKNRFNALFFCTGLDFLPDGRVVVCTCHGDVWLVTVNEKAATCSWQRYATGLYHPLGLKVVDGKVVVLERGQLTRLHDLNADGEADFYECVNNDWHCGGGEHSYDTCLETDPHGNFYFFKTGDTDTPTGGCLMRVSKDGSKSEIFSTGFRHPIGMGMSPTGILTGADQEGNWMPATRIDEYKRGGFYGDMRAHHRPSPPATYDPPLCWLPREVDNSAGGQVWVPKDTFGALAGVPLHFSYGRCKPFVLLRQDCGNGVTQGGVAALPVQFLSGVCRGRFSSDGHLYTCGLNGWQTAAKADGCLQRVRMTGKPLDVPVAMEVKGNAINLTFSRPLDAKAVAGTDNYRAAWWNYRWSGEYGSKRWKVSDLKAEGQDDVSVRSAKLSTDGRTLELTFAELKPVMQMMVGYNVKAADGKPVVGSVYLTIHTTGK